MRDMGSESNTFNNREVISFKAHLEDPGMIAFCYIYNDESTDYEVYEGSKYLGLLTNVLIKEKVIRVANRDIDFKIGNTVKFVKDLYLDYDSGPQLIIEKGSSFKITKINNEANLTYALGIRAICVTIDYIINEGCETTKIVEYVKES